jgi:hypothetical protein
VRIEWLPPGRRYHRIAFITKGKAKDSLMFMSYHSNYSTSRIVRRAETLSMLGTYILQFKILTLFTQNRLLAPAFQHPVDVHNPRNRASTTY